jgi:hypothetical protein
LGEGGKQKVYRKLYAKRRRGKINKYGIGYEVAAAVSA